MENKWGLNTPPELLPKIKQNQAKNGAGRGAAGQKLTYYKFI